MFSALQIAKTESSVEVQRAFRCKFKIFRHKQMFGEDGRHRTSDENIKIIQVGVVENQTVR